MTDLVEIAKSLFAEGKGLLADDEPTAHADRWLGEHGIVGTPETRHIFREILLDTADIEHYLSGVILFTGLLTEKADDGRPFPEILVGKHILPGVKVDEGTEPFPESPRELITKGLLGLEERLAPYRACGATFTKWRAVVTIEGDTLPSAAALVENAKRLASYSRIVQEAGLVPILEAEVLHAGKHSRLRTKEVLTDTLTVLFKAIEEQSVDRTALIIKTSMALSGVDGAGTDTPEQVAVDTLDALFATVPHDVPGIVFLSGGQTPEQSTANLAAITKRAREAGAPWPLTFSYARALQEEALAIWKGKPENVEAARTAYISRLKGVAAALAS